MVRRRNTIIGAAAIALAGAAVQADARQLSPRDQALKDTLVEAQRALQDAARAVSRAADAQSTGPEAADELQRAREALLAARERLALWAGPYEPARDTAASRAPAMARPDGSPPPTEPAQTQPAGGEDVSAAAEPQASPSERGRPADAPAAAETADPSAAEEADGARERAAREQSEREMAALERGADSRSDGAPAAQRSGQSAVVLDRERKVELEPDEVLTLERARGLVGKPVLDPYGEQIAQVVDVGRAPDGEPLFVVKYGGLFGLFEDRAYVGADHVVTAYEDELVVDLTEDTLDGLPRAD